MTQGERLTRIETILERIERKIDKVEEEQRKDIAELAALKNRGAGFLIGVSLLAGSAGAGIARFWHSIFGG